MMDDAPALEDLEIGQKLLLEITKVSCSATDQTSLGSKRKQREME